MGYPAVELRKAKLKRARECDGSEHKVTTKLFMFRAKEHFEEVKVHGVGKSFLVFYKDVEADGRRLSSFDWDQWLSCGALDLIRLSEELQVFCEELVFRFVEEKVVSFCDVREQVTKIIRSCERAVL